LWSLTDKSIGLVAFFVFADSFFSFGIAASLVALPTFTHRLFSCLAPMSNIIVKRISLTPAGEAVLKAIEPVRQQLSDRLFGALGEQEREQLTTFLGQLNQRLQELEEDFQEQTDSVLIQPVTRRESD
jgi:hypothetical protein